ncbi:MAG: hypothetical protein IPK92_15900 [Nitrospira sp.]|nr:hypothetical protein [Nitrospira sp.]
MPNHLTLSMEKKRQKQQCSIFLTTDEIDKTIFVEIIFTSDNPKALLSDIPNRLTAKGYAVTTDPAKAYFLFSKPRPSLWPRRNREPHWIY